MNKTRLIIVIVLFASLLLLTSTLVLAQVVVTPNYGTATPDGLEFEWNTIPGPTNPDWVASTCNPPAASCANPTGDFFMRFDTQINPSTNPPPGRGDMIILWLARSPGVYNKDASTCAFPACNNWIRLTGNPGDFVDDSAFYLNNPYPPTPGSGDVWRHLIDGKGFETTIIEWDCGIMYSLDFQVSVNGQASSTGILDITPKCISINSNHGIVGQTGSVTNDTVTIASTFPVTATGTVTWHYCFNPSQNPNTSATFPNGCLPTDPTYTLIGAKQFTKLYKDPSPVRVAWNIMHGDAIPILLGPEPAPPSQFIPVSTFDYFSPSFIPTNAGTYCYSSLYQADAKAIGAGYSNMQHTNNSTECFVVSAPTAVSLSSLTAQSGGPSANLPLLAALWAGALAIVGAGVVGIRKLLRMR